MRIATDGVVRELPSGLSYWSVDDSYFSTVGLPIVAGRSFEDAEAEGSLPVAIVSESLARFVAGGENPLGRRISDYSSFGQVIRGETPALVGVGLIAGVALAFPASA